MSDMSTSTDGLNNSGALKKSTTDQLLFSLSRKYEEKNSQRSTSGRNTPQSRDGRSVFSGRSSTLASPSAINYGTSGRQGSFTPTGRGAAGSPLVGSEQITSPGPTDLRTSHEISITSTVDQQLASSDGGLSAAATTYGRLSRSSFLDTTAGHEVERLRFSSRHDRIVSPAAMDEAARTAHSQVVEVRESKDKDNGRASLPFNQVLSSPRLTSMAAGSWSVAGHGVEKEIIDSFLRKLEGENSSLKAENKTLKEKYNRALADAAQLEGKMRSVDEENLRLQAELKKERTKVLNRSAEDRISAEARTQAAELATKLQSLKIENESLHQELASAKALADSLSNQGGDSRVIPMYKEESALLREEVKKIKLLLRQCEKDLADESESHRKTMEEKKRLEDANSAFRDQLEADGGSITVAGKQAKSIEKRLKITEERLFQERADRANKLSEVEEKLLTENAQLQIEVKELNRHLSREREKFKTVDAKMRSLKEQQMSLDFVTAASASARRYMPVQKSGGAKFSPDIARIAEEVGRSQSVPVENMEDLVRLLHGRERLAMQRVDGWQSELKELKELSSRSGEQVAEADRLREANDELRGRLEQTELTLYGEISKLVKEKHDLSAKLKINEDLIEGMKAELDSLRSQRHYLSANAASGAGATEQAAADRLHELELTLKDARSRLAQAERERDETRAEHEGAVRLLKARDKALEDATAISAAGAMAEQLREQLQQSEECRLGSERKLVVAQECVASLQLKVDGQAQQLSEQREQYMRLADSVNARRDSALAANEQLLADAEVEIGTVKESLMKERLDYSKAKGESDQELTALRSKIVKLQKELQHQGEVAETLRAAKVDLSKDLDVSGFKLSEMRRKCAGQQLEIASLNGRNKDLTEERDRLLREKHDALLSLAQTEGQLRQAAIEHEQQLREAKRDLKTQRKELKVAVTRHSVELSKVTAELEAANRTLETKEKDLQRSIATMEQHQHSILQLSEKAADLQTALNSSRNQQKELEANVEMRDRQLASLERAALGSESNSSGRLRLLETELDERKLREMKTRSELIAAEDAKNRLKEQMDKLAASLAVALEEKETSVADVQRVADELKEELALVRLEGERNVRIVQDKLERVLADLKAADATIAAVTQTKDHLQTMMFSLEKKLEQRSQEQAIKERLLEQKSESAFRESEETRSYASAAEQRLTDMQSLLTKAESDLKCEREKVVRLQQDRQALEAQVASLDFKIRGLQNDLDQSQKELKAAADKAGSANQLVTKFKLQVSELKKQLSFENDHTIKQLHKQLAEKDQALEEERQQAAVRRAELAGQKERVATLDGKLTDALTRLKQAEESLSVQDEQQDAMKRRNLELEVELTELRGLLSRLDSSVPTTGSDPKIDNLTRAELNRTMQEWSTRLQALLELQRKDQGGNGGTAESDQRHQHEQCKLKVLELDGKLKHEQLMHALTRNQLKAADDDNTKLRKLLYGGRRRRPGTEDGSIGKSRAELINERIAAAQARAQVMMNSATSSTVSAPASASSDDHHSTGTAGATLLGSLLLSSSLLATPRFERLNNAVLHNNTSPAASPGDRD